jgi:tetratricopeptide (TPR) repeat protein
VPDQLPPATPIFVGRPLGAVDEALASGDGVVIGPDDAHYLGGIGTSQLAVQFAYARAHHYPLRWWIAADNTDSIDAGLASLADAVDASGGEQRGTAQARGAAVAWLQAHPGWLLVLDNVLDPGHVAGLVDEVHNAGHVIVTTSWSLDTAPYRGLRPLLVEPLDQAAGIELLTRISGRPGGDAAGRIVERLDGLPLALELAGAYLSQQPRLSFDGYLEALATGADAAAQLNIAAVTPESPLARTLLDVLAYLGPDQVPESLLEPLGDAAGRYDALTRLGAYRLITRTPAGINLHRRVQAVARAGAPNGLDRAIQLLSQAVPQANVSTVESWPAGRALLPHIDAVTRHLPPVAPSGPVTPETRALFIRNQAATYQLRQGQFASAIARYASILTDHERLLGNGHPDSLAALSNLASAYEAAGDHAAAITRYEDLVDARRRLLGLDHELTIVTSEHLARLYRTASQPVRAIGLYERVLASRGRVLGDDHRETHRARSELAYAYWDAGNAAAAVPLFATVHAACRRLLGPDHPETLTMERYLASARQAAS